MMTFPEDLSIVKIGEKYSLALADIGEHTLTQLQEEFIGQVAPGDETNITWSEFSLWLAIRYQGYSIKTFDCLEYFQFEGKTTSNCV